jgi:hypothetical protein
MLGSISYGRSIVFKFGAAILVRLSPTMWSKYKTQFLNLGSTTEQIQWLILSLQQPYPYTFSFLCSHPKFKVSSSIPSSHTAMLAIADARVAALTVDASTSRIPRGCSCRRCSPVHGKSGAPLPRPSRRCGGGGRRQDPEARRALQHGLGPIGAGEESFPPSMMLLAPRLGRPWWTTHLWVSSLLPIQNGSSIRSSIEDVCLCYSVPAKTYFWVCFSFLELALGCV